MPMEESVRVAPVKGIRPTAVTVCPSGEMEIRPMNRVLPLIMALCVLTPCVIAQDGEEQTLTTLNKIVKNPEAFRGLKATFVVQFHRLGNVDNPVYSQFDKHWYQNFSAWSDGVKLWERDAFHKDFPYLFLPRVSEATEEVASAPMFTRFLATGVVREVYNNQPWIEVVALQQLDRALNPNAVRQFARGYQLRNSRDHAGAAAAFHAADAKTLPSHLRSLAVREEARDLHQSGRSMDGLMRLRQAQAWLDDDTQVAQAIETSRVYLGLDEDFEPIVTEEVVAVEVTPQTESQPVQVSPVQVSNPAPVQNETPKSQPTPSPDGITRSGIEIGPIVRIQPVQQQQSKN